jgi:monoamine oxidase
MPLLFGERRVAKLFLVMWVLFQRCMTILMHFGLMGFLNGAYHSVSKEERLEMILKQLTKYYGNLVFQKMYANGRFILAGKETSPVYSGYMEGAIRSVKSTSEKTKRVFKAIICKIHLLFR